MVDVEVKQWLESEQNFRHGVSLFKQINPNKVLHRRFDKLGETPYNKALLKEKLYTYFSDLPAKPANKSLFDNTTKNIPGGQNGGPDAGQKTDILIISVVDWCNRGYKMVKALKTTGLNVEGCALKRHKFLYPDYLPVVPKKVMQKMCDNARLVWYAHGEVPLAYDIKAMNAVVTHSGTRYRQRYDEHNRVFDFVKKTVLLGHDHMKLGAKNPTYNSCRIIDTEKLQPVHHKRDIPVIGHFPSQPIKKGTEVIEKVLNELLEEGWIFEKRLDTNLLPYDENIKRMQDCDIYIEQLMPFDKNGNIFGELSNQSYEASALGNVVVSNLTNPYYYRNTHGKHKIIISNTENSLKNNIKKLLKLSKEELYDLQQKTRRWVEQSHSFEAMGASLKKTIEDLIPEEDLPKSNGKPNVCFVYDTKGWAFYNKALSVKQHLQEYYNITLAGILDIQSYDLKKYDVVIIFHAPQYEIFKRIESTGEFSLDKLIVGNSGFKSLPYIIENLKHVGYAFSNNPELFENLPNKNKYYCPNGIDTGFFAGKVRSVKNKKCFNLAIVGSKGKAEHKGAGRLEKICSKLKAQGYNVHDKSLIVNPADQNTILSKEEMIKYYEDIDIFIISSVSEGTPNPLLEAMAMGIPVVANNVGFAPLLIEKGKTGFLVNDYDNIKDYVKYIAMLIDNHSLYEYVSKNSLKKIKEYDWSVMALNYKKMIDDFLNKRPKQQQIKENSTGKLRPVCFVGTASGKFKDEFIDINKEAFLLNGFEPLRYKNSREFQKAVENKEIDRNISPVVVIVYCEDDELRGKGERKDYDAFEIEKICKQFNNPVIIHPTKMGLIIGNKERTNALLSEAGVICPRQIKSKKHDKPVFQNETNKSNQKTQILPAGTLLDTEKYNCEFIDTSYSFDGKVYFCCIRVLCVGKEIVSIYPRFRNKKEKDASVHNKNTPRLPELLNSYYYEKIVPNKEKIKKTCAKIGDVLGLGFYTHDIALSGNNIYVLEIGYKLHDRSWSERMERIKDEIVLDATPSIIMKKLAYEFILQLKSL